MKEYLNRSWRITKGIDDYYNEEFHVGIDGINVCTCYCKEHAEYLVNTHNEYLKSKETSHEERSESNG